MTRRLGIDIGGTKMLAVVVESDDANGAVAIHTEAIHEVVEEVRVAAPVGGDIVAAITSFAGSFDAISSVGIGLAGLVRHDDIVVTTTHLPNVRGIALRGLVEERLGVAVAVDNDATCAAVAEWRVGAAHGCDDALVVTIGTGIGGGSIVNGRIARGAHGFAGEFGHMVVVRDGEPCPCGRRGCWEGYVSGRGLRRLAGGADPEHVLERFAAGDDEAVRVVDEFAHWAAIGLFNLTSAMDPSRIVLGGGIGSVAGLLPVIDRHFRATVAGHHGRDLPRIVTASLGDRAGAIGAAFIGAGD